MATQPKPTVTHHENVTVISFGPELESLDEVHLEVVGETILNAADKADPPRLVVDLSNVNFFGSSFIEILFRMANRMSGREGGRFAIAGLTPYCAEVLSITHLDELWPTFDTVDGAVAELQS